MRNNNKETSRSIDMQVVYRQVHNALANLGAEVTLMSASGGLDHEKQEQSEKSPGGGFENAWKAIGWSRSIVQSWNRLFNFTYGSELNEQQVKNIFYVLKSKYTEVLQSESSESREIGAQFMKEVSAMDNTQVSCLINILGGRPIPLVDANVFDKESHPLSFALENEAKIFCTKLKHSVTSENKDKLGNIKNIVSLFETGSLGEKDNNRGPSEAELGDLEKNLKSLLGNTFPALKTKSGFVERAELFSWMDVGEKVFNVMRPLMGFGDVDFDTRIFESDIGKSIVALLQFFGIIEEFEDTDDVSTFVQTRRAVKRYQENKEDDKSKRFLNKRQLKNRYQLENHPDSFTTMSGDMYVRDSVSGIWYKPGADHSYGAFHEVLFDNLSFDALEYACSNMVQGGYIALEDGFDLKKYVISLLEKKSKKQKNKDRLAHEIDVVALVMDHLLVEKKKVNVQEQEGEQTLHSWDLNTQAEGTMQKTDESDGDDSDSQ